MTSYTVGKGRKCKRKGSWAAFNRRIHAYKDGMCSAYDVKESVKASFKGGKWGAQMMIH